MRNKIEHDKERFWSDATLAAGKAYVSETLIKIIDVISSLVRIQAVPAWAYVTHQIQDAWSRMTYRFVLDDGSLSEAKFTQNLNLGGVYLYFGGDVNPRPVDPLILPFDEQQDVP